MQLADSATRTATLEKQIEEAKARETQLRTNNKVIRLCSLAFLENLIFPADYTRRASESAVFSRFVGETA